MPKKELALIVNQPLLTRTELRQITNDVSGVGNAISALSGNAVMSKNVMNFPGSNSGFKKAILFGDFQNSPDTALSKSSKSKTTGSINSQGTTPISPTSDTSSMTALISERITALSPS